MKAGVQVEMRKSPTRPHPCALGALSPLHTGEGKENRRFGRGEVERVCWWQPDLTPARWAHCPLSTLERGRRTAGSGGGEVERGLMIE